MNVLIAKTREECAAWNQTAVIVDVLRTTATVCALLGKGARPVKVCREEKTAQQWKAAQPDMVIFSEKQLTGIYEDNSPHLATKLPAVQQALVVEDESAVAAQTLRAAGLLLLGGFCNFSALAEVLRAQGKDVLLVPASLFGKNLQEEDLLCAEGLKNFLQGIGSPQEAVDEFINTVRYAEYRSQGPRTAAKDLQLALAVNSLPFVPQAVRTPGAEGIACFPYGEPQLSVENPADTTSGMLKPLGDTGEQAQPSQTSSTLSRQLGERTSRLKGFFADLVRAAKEEKAELEQSIRQTALKHRREQAPKIDDPMDTVLKKSSRAANPPQAVQPVPISDAGVNPVTKDPFGQRSISLDTPEEKHLPPEQSHTDRVKISRLDGGEVENNGFGERSISLDTQTAPEHTPHKQNTKKAIVLFSGGLDSTTCLYWALNQGYTCETLTVSYGQRHVREVDAARRITNRLGVKHHHIELHLPWLAQASSLVNANQPLPDIAVEQIPQAGIPSTYVPGRNLMFLSIAGSLLDSVQAQAIIAGPNAIDFSGYPDCTPAFFKAAGEALNRGTQQGVREGIEVLAPLMRLSKAEIVKLAAELKVPFELTWSCYAGGEKPCGRCDSCKLRAKGFAEAGVHDSALD